MKRTSMLTLAAAVGLSACSETPVGLTDPTPIGETIVITEGVVAAPFNWRPRVAHSTLANAAPTLGGSTTTAVAVNGTACTTFPTQLVTIIYTLSGNQKSSASFKVPQKWDYNGVAFVSSADTTVAVAAKTGGGDRTYAIQISIENSAETGTGATSFVVTPFGLVTESTDPPGQQLELDASSSATIHVAFTDCTPSNTPPSITVPSDITVEATGPTGAIVTFVVTAQDSEDEPADLTIECSHASGSTFPLGTTTVTCTARDTGGLESEAASFDVNVVDTTPPAISGIPASLVTLIAEDAEGATYDASGITALDLVDGVVAVDCSPLTFAIGETGTVSCTASDTRGNTTTPPEEFEVLVTLDFSGGQGFLSPLRMAAPYSAHKLGSTVPHKFPAPQYADGSLATDLVDLLRFALNPLPGNTAAPVEIVDGDYSAGSTEWRYDTEQEIYIYNLKTPKTGWAGFWTTMVSIGSVELAKTTLELRK